MSVGVKADDGMNLSRLEQRFGRTPADLPGDAEVDKMIATVTGDLDALHDAPLAEPYVGPAILEGRAAGVFFHEVFGHRIEGHRQKDLTERPDVRELRRQGHRARLAERSTTIPQLVTLNGIQLNGFYRFDDEGVRAHHVPLIDHGKLVGFEMGRNPITGLPALERPRPALAGPAAGRAPGQPRRRGREAASTRADLEKMLIEEIKKQHRPYGMIFTDISGGFTNTSAFAPQAFKVNPVMAYRLYPDGQQGARARHRHQRHAARRAAVDPRGEPRDRDVQRRVRRGERLGAGVARRRRACCSRSSRSRRASSRRIARRCSARRRSSTRKEAP